MLDERQSVGERYLNAASSGHPAGCDVDVLLAVGWAASSPRKQFGLALWRLRATVSRPGFDLVLRSAIELLHSRTRRPRHGTRLLLTEAEQRTVASDVLRWWIEPICRFCQGRGRQTGQGGALLPTPCKACSGERHMPLAQVVPAAYLGAARWLADEFDRHTALVFAAAAARLREAMDEALR